MGCERFKVAFESIQMMRCNLPEVDVHNIHLVIDLSLTDLSSNAIGMGKMKAAIYLLLILGPMSLQAQEVPKNYTAETMLNLCRGTAEEDAELQSMVCTFRIQGVTSIMVENCLSMEQGFDPLPILSSQLPPSKGAARQAFMNFMEKNPDVWGLPWHMPLSLALAETFPCDK